MFISFEGCEGSGKSTQVKMLEQAIAAEFNQVVTTREPGGTQLAEHLRQVLLAKHEITDPLTEYLIFAAARRDHVENFIKPNLDKKFVVICDRFFDSSLAYQGYAKGLDFEKMMLINQLTLDGFKPDITILLDINPEISLQRVHNRAINRGDNNHYDTKELEFHNKIRHGFLEIANMDKNRFFVINAAENAKEIHKKIYSVISTRLKNLHLL